MHGAQRHDALQQVFKLADIAGKVVRLETLDRGAVERFSGKPSRRARTRKGAREIADVIEPLTQWRELNGDDVEAVKQIGAERALARERAEAALRGGRSGAHSGAPPGRWFARGPRGAFATSLGRSSTSSRKSVPAIGFGELAVRSEEIAFEPRARSAGEADRDERRVGAAAKFVQRACDALFAGAALAFDQAQVRSVPVTRAMMR